MLIVGVTVEPPALAYPLPMFNWSPPALVANVTVAPLAITGLPLAEYVAEPVPRSVVPSAMLSVLLTVTAGDFQRAGGERDRRSAQGRAVVSAASRR